MHPPFLLTFILYTFCYLIFPLLSIHAQQLSEETKVSLLTATPGNEIYSHFGHSALRIVDPVHQIDQTYNYGVFDFKTDHFILKFIRGKLPYRLSTSKYRNFKYQYQQENRTVYEQTFKLSLVQKQRLHDLLKTNLLPENRNYPYDFFFDNCSTRIRDILQKATHQQIQFPDTLQQPPPTFRDLLQPYLKEVSWLKLGIHLILGTPTDKMATVKDQMFLPDYLMEAADQAFIQTDSSRVPLVQNKQISIKTLSLPPSSSYGLLSPTILLWLVCALLLFWTLARPPFSFQQLYWVDFFLFGLMGWIGCLWLFMWWGTDHIATNQNWNMLWAFPLHIFFVWGLVKRDKPYWFAYYWLFTLVLLSITLLSILAHLFHILLLPQVLPALIFPIVLLLWVRAYYLFQWSRKLLFVGH